MINKNRKRVLTTATLPLPLLRGHLLCCHLGLTRLARDFPSSNRRLIHTFISVWTKLFPIGLEIVTYSNILSPRRRQRKQRTWGPKPYKAEVKTDVKLLWTSFYSQPPPSLLSQLLENPVWCRGGGWGGYKLHRPWPTAEQPPRASVANIWKLQWTGRDSEVQARCDSTWL